MTTKAMNTVSTQREPAWLLRRTLQINALISGLTGAGMALASGAVAQLLGLAGSLPIALLGIDLVLFGAWVGYEALQPALRLRRAWVVLALDIVWVVASALVLALDPFGLSTIGKWAVAAVADVVALFALGEYVGLRRMRGR